MVCALSGEGLSLNYLKHKDLTDTSGRVATRAAERLAGQWLFQEEVQPWRTCPLSGPADGKLI